MRASKLVQLARLVRMHTHRSTPHSSGLSLFWSRFPFTHDLFWIVFNTLLVLSGGVLGPLTLTTVAEAVKTRPVPLNGFHSVHTSWTTERGRERREGKERTRERGNSKVLRWHLLPALSLPAVLKNPPHHTMHWPLSLFLPISLLPSGSNRDQSAHLEHTHHLQTKKSGHPTCSLWMHVICTTEPSCLFLQLKPSVHTQPRRQGQDTAKRMQKKPCPIV